MTRRDIEFDAEGVILRGWFYTANSDGEPRQEIDPVAQTRDYRHAITYAKTLPEVDGEKIGIWGSSFSGGHVQVVAAYDKRVKAAVAQVPFVSGIRQRASARP